MSEQRQTRPSEQLKQIIWLTEAQAALSWGILIGILAILGAIYLYQASRIATVGRRVQILQDQLDGLKRDNASLEQAIAEAESLERLQSEAARLGFVISEPDDIEYIVIADYPAEVTAVATPTPVMTPLPRPPETIGDAIWFSFRDLIVGLIQGVSQ